MSEAARWQRVKEIFDAAVGGRVEDRATLVRELCGDDQALQAEVESLLAADASGRSIFDRSVDRELRGRVFDAVAGAFDDGSRALAPGDRLGPYEIAGLLGRGGMGEVYRARDTKLNRDVAVKSSRARWRPIPIDSPGSGARRSSSRRSIIQTSVTSTVSKTRTSAVLDQARHHPRWCSSSSKDRRWPI